MITGYGAIVSLLTAADLPDVGCPELILEDDGELCADWDGDRCTLSVSVREDGRMSWAALIQGWKAHGTCQGTPDESLKEALTRLSGAMR